MKTLSQVKQEEAAAEAKRIQDEHDYNMQILKNAKSIKPELSISGNDAVRIQQGLQTATMSPIGIACDNCGVELASTKPHMVLMSYPPKINIGCPGCGWTGYKTLKV